MNDYLISNKRSPENHRRGYIEHADSVEDALEKAKTKTGWKPENIQATRCITTKNALEKDEK